MGWVGKRGMDGKRGAGAFPLECKAWEALEYGRERRRGERGGREERGQGGGEAERGGGGGGRSEGLGPLFLSFFALQEAYNS